MKKYHGTVKGFLAAGHRFVEGDIFTNKDGDVFNVVGRQCDADVANKAGIYDEMRQVVYAACLNKEPEPEYELVNCGFDSIIDAGDYAGDVFTVRGHPARIQNSDYGISFFEVNENNPLALPLTYRELYRRVPLRTKTITYPMPETKTPEVGTEYYYAAPSGIIGEWTWQGSTVDFNHLKAGNVFLKREHAQGKADAQSVEIEE